MNSPARLVDIKAAEDCLMRLLVVEGLSGEEAAIADAVIKELLAVGVSASSIRFDTAHERITLPTQTGNLFVDLPGTIPGPRLMFATHLDTVQLCAGVKPRREGDRIITDGTTALGGDNRTGCAVLITLVKTLLENSLPHPPLTLLFTVREESGIQGARALEPVDLGDAVMCFNVDSKLPAELIIGGCWARELASRNHGPSRSCRCCAGERDFVDLGRVDRFGQGLIETVGLARSTSPMERVPVMPASLVGGR